MTVTVLLVTRTTKYNSDGQEDDDGNGGSDEVENSDGESSWRAQWF